MFGLAALASCLFLEGAFATTAPTQFPLTSDLLRELSEKVEGRLYSAVAFAEPCFTSFKSADCEVIKRNYLNETSRFDTFGGYINTQWETCQTTGEQCLLDWEDPTNPGPVSSSQTCQLGSVSRHFIDVRKPADVAAAFDYSRRSGVPLIVKNTGHDYKGRSSAPGSIGLWTHNLKDITYDPEFIPEGCVKASPGVTMGAGVQWGEAYQFAEAHNITLVGGSDPGVGTSGGWLMGGGHGALTNTMGMGVDRVLQFKVVTPDGKLRVANACQNEDLFFALRGGGGGTFGVVLESTTLASPPVTLQVYVVQWTNPEASLTHDLWSILIENGLKWADEGWGGFANGESAIYISPNLDTVRANVSMAPLIAFGERIKHDGIHGATLTVLEFPTWGTFFNAFAGDNSAAIGVNLALASRLIPKANFETAASRSELLAALLKAHTLTPGLRFLVSPPTSCPGDGSTSVTPAWRDSVYHITLITTWDWNATMGEKKTQYKLASDSISHLRAITPDAAYSNEADVYEPNHKVAFWGDNYSRLLEIKDKYDPDRLLDCWQCVGWTPNSKRFACYIA
ncbi:FAD-binding domain-containing protein [Gloeophyllum trabeum ATCC 11539]|uniref:FAD-binding domain-containing protein n=1 Tax=Gloeophyllum trabeum (strain ATCC 11539 / FP-39264 / Madison 617) TaxID=670483 RepID=S7R9M5_GLOTA|nr:FAD-binding domain-containing protein [Gloeophyllum trabeum ATCC 11539]EPQ50955.1 FAD-binding domain-containing protein [Gloeophyllum trabeum ATCC 11539]